MLNVVARLALLVVAIIYGVVRFGPLLEIQKPALMMSPQENAKQRYGLSLEKRKEIFSIIARGEPARIEQIKKKNASLFYKKTSFEQTESRLIRNLAEERNLHVAVVVAIFHEGIRKKWKFQPDAQPLSARPVF